MATTPNSIITPQAPMSRFADLSAIASPITSRAPITAVAGLTALITTAQNVNGVQVNNIVVKASSSAQSATVAQSIYIWQYNGTTSYLVDEIITTAVTPSTSAASFRLVTYYKDWILPAGSGLYVSTSIATGAATTALVVQVNGGDL